MEDFFEYNKIIFAKIGKEPNVKTIFGFYPNNKVLRVLYQLQHSKTTNKFFSLPLKSLWFNTYFKNDFANTNRPIVFIFDARLLEYDYIRDYVVWLKKKYSGCKLVVNYWDIVATWIDSAKPDAIRGMVDMLVSYDKDDAKKYNMYYHPTVYAEAKISKPNNTPESDVFFIGGAKNRMKTILETYDKLEKAGLSCLFYVMDANPPYNQERRGIHYISGKKWISYEECVQFVQHSKCVLEIMQQGARGETLRVWEAITYGKMLLTNNTFMRESRFYNPDYVSIISEDKEIDTQRIKDYVCKPNPFKSQITPDNLLRYIEENL